MDRWAALDRSDPVLTSNRPAVHSPAITLSFGVRQTRSAHGSPAHVDGHCAPACYSSARPVNRSARRRGARPMNEALRATPSRKDGTSLDRWPAAKARLRGCGETRPAAARADLATPRRRGLGGASPFRHPPVPVFSCHLRPDPPVHVLFSLAGLIRGCRFLSSPAGLTRRPYFLLAPRARRPPLSFSLARWTAGPVFCCQLRARPAGPRLFLSPAGLTRGSNQCWGQAASSPSMTSGARTLGTWYWSHRSSGRSRRPQLC
jgi:hypothetical protein